QVDLDRRRQLTQPVLGGLGLVGGSGLGQHRINQLERHLPGQLTQMPGREHPAATLTVLTMTATAPQMTDLSPQRRSLTTGKSWSTRLSYRTSVAVLITPAQRVG